MYVNKLLDKIINGDYDLSYSELKVLYEINDILENDMKEFSEIDDYFLEWLDSKKWGINKAIAPGCYIFHISGGFKEYSDFFSDLDMLSKRRQLNIKINTISCANFLALSVRVYKNKNDK
jgi:hypothetical protein